jgi:hypothetical protein
MDQKMPLKLPRYVFRRANGSFRYKRNVPKDLRAVIPKATVSTPEQNRASRRRESAPLDWNWPD